MKRLEFRRHGERGAGKGLTGKGWRAAEAVGRTLESPYQLVLSSPKRRCVETARAFGFVHFLQDTRLAPFDLEPLEPFARKIRKVRKAGSGVSWVEAALTVPESRAVLHRLAHERLRELEVVLHFLPEGGKALLVTHGDLMEAIALLGATRYEWEPLGAPFGHTEGFELAFDGGRIAGLRLLRRDEPAAAKVKRPAPKLPRKAKPVAAAAATEGGGA